MRKWIVVGIALAVAGCQEGAEEAPEGTADTVATGEEARPGTGMTTEFAPELGVDLDGMEETPSGLRYEVLEEGTGETAESGDTVVVHYTGWLPDGTTFDSSRERGEPFQFMVGAGRVIPGWDEGVAGMRVGETRRLVVPPDLGYGAQGAGTVIPPDATLVFEVDLLEIR